MRSKYLISLLSIWATRNFFLTNKIKKQLTNQNVTLPCYHARDIDEPIDELYFSQKNFRVKSYQQLWCNWWNIQCRSDGATHFAALLQSEIWFLSKHLQAGLLSGFLELHLLRYIKEGIVNFFKSSVSSKDCLFVPSR